MYSDKKTCITFRLSLSPRKSPRHKTGAVATRREPFSANRQAGSSASQLVNGGHGACRPNIQPTVLSTKAES